ncbi:NrfD/PsrC family molybdoenzyme membrane anchor subunit [Hydrogenimonas urashimensis]|uniref:NrfD/PsrC family molybdoenzyme membrane anchor subunit n=1 Tax=Hydrogenimonas urashimensis TaxID=2740515 RepID=UPI001915EB71|nr:NrfD/PsrC family molybdoenzyme membrane anchor subunit [Hydrogenimonas urashimensis]
MVEHAHAATQAVVTLDVALPGIVWGWMITLNMWAKSIGTGVILVGVYLLKKYGDRVASVKTSMPVVSFIFLNIFLLFTLLDLHHPFRMLNIFLHPHWTSAITVGAWLATILTGIIFVMAAGRLLHKLDDEPFNRLMWAAFIFAIPVTLYTATILGEAAARELWQTPTELFQMAMAAFIGGSATYLILGVGDQNVKRDLGIVLAVSASLSLIVYLGEYYFGAMKAEEVAATIAFVKEGGAYHTMFWVGQTLGYILPIVLVIFGLRTKSSSLLALASVLALAGLWIAKHVWLVIPQLMNLS